MKKNGQRKIYISRTKTKNYDDMRLKEEHC